MLSIKGKLDVLQLIADFKKTRPKEIAFDTETDGLNIKHNKPFLFVFGFKDGDDYKTYDLDLDHTPYQTIIDTMYVFKKFMCKYTEKILGHNITFDLHMLRNMGYPIHFPEKYEETQVYIRLAHDAVTTEYGGAPIGLKEYATRYIDKKASLYEKPIKAEIAENTRKRTLELKRRLKDFPVPDEFKVSGKEKQWTKAMIDEFFKDQLNEVDDLPDGIKEVVKKWLIETPDPDNYRLLDRKNVTIYAHKDIELTLKVFYLNEPKVRERGQISALKIEQEAIQGFYELESTGIDFDYQYALDAKKRMKAYVKHKRAQFHEILGEKITVNQHDRFREIVLNKYMVNLLSTNKDYLEHALEHPDLPEDVKKLIGLLGKLRTLEKWYGLYLTKWIKEYEKFNSSIMYPQYQSAGTVTGRVSSDFQQMPKGAIKDDDGNVIYYPRGLFKTRGGFNTFYLDYSSMEMRIQAIFTMLISKGDLNLCRCFIPLECAERNGKWYLNEDPNTEWHPLDPHGTMTKNAFNVTEEVENFKSLRDLGKRANFALIYGATPKTLQNSLRVSSKVARDLYRAYYKTFPKIQDYVNYIKSHIEHYGYAQNLFGRRYYGASYHNARNYLIQGTGADYTKSLLPKIVKLLEPYKSRIQGYLHDEFSFLIAHDERHLVPKLKELMESLDTSPKLAVDVEYSDTKWSEKRDYTTT